MEKITVEFRPPEWLNELIESNKQVHEAAQTLKVELENLNRIIKKIQQD